MKYPKRFSIRMSIYRFELIFPLILLIFGSMSLPKTVSAHTQEDFAPNEVLVKLANANDLPAVAASYGLDPVPIDRFGARPIFRLRIMDGSLPTTKSELLAQDPEGRILYVEPNFLSGAPEKFVRVIWPYGGGPAAYKGQWAGPLIGLPRWSPDYQFEFGLAAADPIAGGDCSGIDGR